jgi:hypothetical protein
MERTTRLLLTWEAAMRKANLLDISRENMLRIRFLDVSAPGKSFYLRRHYVW